MKKELIDFMDKLNAHLDAKKVFVENPDRIAQVLDATRKANELFSEANVVIADDPLQTGALTICIEDFDVVANTKKEIEDFKQMISGADNFEIYPIVDGKVRFDIMFRDALIRVQ